MPADFEKCVRENPGKVRTVKAGANGYLHICIDKNGKWHRGEVRMKGKK